LNDKTNAAGRRVEWDGRAEWGDQLQKNGDELSFNFSAARPLMS